MHGIITLQGVEYPVDSVELHLPEIDETRMMYLSVSTKTGANMSFNLWDVEIALLENIDDLDGKRIHLHPDGESYEDDTLGADIIGAMTDANYWFTSDGGYVYGDILIDFKRIKGQIYRVTAEISLADSDEDPEDLSPEDFSYHASLDFMVTVDEKNPMYV
jgi:hypothetical protein